jgi:SPP1 family predicted phage head-tail adaptor
MRPGNQRITLQSRAAGKDASGARVDVWVGVPNGELWAGILPMSARERMVAQANQSELTHVVEIRYQTAFADPRYMATLRILYGTRIFNIHGAIDEAEQHKWILLSCSEGLNDG